MLMRLNIVKTLCACVHGGGGGGWDVLRLQGVLMGDRTVDGFCVQ